MYTLLDLKVVGSLLQTKICHEFFLVTGKPVCGRNASEYPMSRYYRISKSSEKLKG